jgi:leader peptidase (prepilin peptidase)/N-methyltransferase
VLLGLLGAVFGSFVNVVAGRVPAGETLVGRSRCPRCGHVLGPLELVPVLSWLALRGRCRHCRGAISWAYPAVELACGALFVGLGLRFGDSAALIPALIGGVGLVTLGLVDLRCGRVPGVILAPVAVAVSLALVGVAGLEGDWALVGRAVVGGAAAAAGAGFSRLAAPAVVRRDDVALGALGGILATAVSWAALAVAAVLGAGIAVVTRRSAPLGRKPPIGPALASGALLALLLAPQAAVSPL